MERIPLVETDWVKELRAIRSVADRLRALFAGLREQAAGTDPDIAELAAEFGRRQREDTAVFRSLVVGDGVVFAGLDADEDREAVWAVTSSSVYRKLVDECGWSPEQWERWAVGFTEQLLG